MSVYRVKITDEKQNNKTMDIKIDTFEEFIKWYNTFKSFEKGKNITYESIEIDDNIENSIL